jgi:hypothetical protein
MNPTPDEVDPRIAQARPGWALVVLASPIVAFVVVIVLYIGMVSLGLSGRGGDGGRVVYRVAACDEAVEPIAERLRDMGLPAEVDRTRGDVRIVSQRIGRPEIDETVPDTLSTVGRFELRHGDAVLARNEQITDASTRLDGMMDPWLLLGLDEQATDAVVGAVRSDPRGRMHFVVDGQIVAMQPNGRDVQRGEVEGIPVAELTAADRMARVAAWSVIIDHPLPCPATVEILAENE